MVLAPLRPILRALARSVLPDCAAYGEPQWRALEEIVEAALSTHPPAVQRQVRLFLGLVDYLPVLRWGRRFSALPGPRRDRLCAWLERAPLLLLRRGFWGLRTLIFMGHYGRAEVQAALGYRARAEGWELRR